MKIANCQLPIANSRRWPAFRRERAFTLIEMLVVIAIIGILAALIVGLAGPASAVKVRSRVKAELAAYETVIRAYQKQYGFFPPDHTQMPPPLGTPTLNTNQLTTLYYELTGTEPPPAVQAAVFTALGTKGIVNSRSEGKNFHPNLSTKSYGPVPANPDIVLLVVPYKGPAGDYNPWHYRSSKPEHNTDSFDLWAEVTIGGKTEIIGNWKD